MKNFLWILGLALVAIVGGVLLSGCHPLENPPVRVTFRDGFTGGVLQAHNLSSQRIVCHLHVSDVEQKNSIDHTFVLAPNAMTEIGVLEIGWHFDAGEKGYIKVDGFIKKHTFELNKDDRHYKTDYCYF